jgi:O-acetyl-ADP-ribose deacetylase (regulator of RNase III)
MNSVQIEVVHGDNTVEDVDVIVTAANRHCVVATAVIVKGFGTSGTFSWF